VNGTINDLRVTDNTIMLTTFSWPSAVYNNFSSYGIQQYFSSLYTTTYAIIQSGVITGNIIKETEASLPAVANTIGIYVNSLNSSVIGHNTIQGISGAHGILVYLTTRGLKDLLVDANVVQDFGQNSTGFPRAAIGIYGTGSVSGLGITNNMLALSTTSASASAFYLNWDGSTTLNWLLIANNSVRNLPTIAAGPAIGSYTASIPGYTPGQWGLGPTFLTLNVTGVSALSETYMTGPVTINKTIVGDNVLIHGEDLIVDQFVYGSNVVATVGNITAAGHFVQGTGPYNVGLTIVKNVKGSGAGADCTLTFSGGILTGSTCP
jgi:hypothetical protein